MNSMISASDAADRLEKLFGKITSDSFNRLCSMRKISLRPPVTEDFLVNNLRNKIENIIPVLGYSDFPDDSSFYENLFSFSDASVLLGFRRAVTLSIDFLRS